MGRLILNRQVITVEVVLTIAQRCMGYIQTIQITDIIDIAILSYLLYRLLLWARNSNVGQVLKGIAMIFVVLWLTSFFKLHLLYYLLSNMLEVGLLAIVIVFQPEIRHFLEQIGAKGLPTVLINREVQSNESEQAIDQLVEAYAKMSRDKVGALTVFERDSILDDCIKTGTALDAGVSSELLKNIFYPKAPLHDGAVIIRRGRIAGAGCVLPLSGNPNISRELGTRHRAGIGITEHTDAVVAIVSEENGSISVAVGGMLKRHLAPETLRRLLKNELLASENAESMESSDNSKWSGLLKMMSGIFGQNPSQSKRQKEKESDHVE